MDFDFLLRCNALFNEEQSAILSKVTLQLDNQSLLLICYYRPIAMEHFLESPEKFFVIQIVLETLDNCQALSSSTLLVVQVYIIVIIFALTDNVSFSLLFSELFIISTEIDHVCVASSSEHEFSAGSWSNWLLELVVFFRTAFLSFL